jgi:hypothetical protein
MPSPSGVGVESESAETIGPEPPSPDGRGEPPPPAPLDAGVRVGFGLGVADPPLDVGFGFGVGRGVGFGVGFGVGAGVGFGVGLGVGAGVGVGVGVGAVTTIEPGVTFVSVTLCFPDPVPETAWNEYDQVPTGSRLATVKMTPVLNVVPEVVIEAVPMPGMTRTTEDGGHPFESAYVTWNVKIVLVVPETGAPEPPVSVELCEGLLQPAAAATGEAIRKSAPRLEASANTRLSPRTEPVLSRE